jgi:hypothetical protein
MDDLMEKNEGFDEVFIKGSSSYENESNLKGNCMVSHVVC